MERKIIKCEKGHFYNSEKYSKCPHCNPSRVIEEDDVLDVTPADDEKTVAAKLVDDNKTVSAFGSESNGADENENVAKVTPAVDPVVEDNPVGPDVEPPSTQGLADQVRNASANYEGRTMSYFGYMTDDMPAPQPAPQPVQPVQPVQPAPQQAAPVVVEDSGKTVSFFGVIEESAPQPVQATAPAPKVEQVIAPEPQKATAQPPTQPTVVQPTPVAHPTEPPVGWLVCIAGKHFGQYFQIGAGNNTIGRLSDNRIVIALDGKVSRHKHAVLTYEPKKREFFIKEGDGTNLVYVNDEAVDMKQKLNIRDIIELGDTKLLFIPLCGEEFSWEDYM